MSHNAFPASAPLRAVFIDWDGTLSRSRFWGHWANSPDYTSAYRIIQDKFFGNHSKLVQDWMRGHYVAEDVAQTVAKITSLSIDFVLSELADSCRKMIILEPPSLYLIHELRRRGVKAIIATDNMDTFERWTVPSLNLREYFDDILCSHELRLLKLDSHQHGHHSFFSSTLTRYNLKPGHCIIIDDNPKNTSFRSVGFNVQIVSSHRPLTSVLIDIIRSTNR